MNVKICPGKVALGVKKSSYLNTINQEGRRGTGSVISSELVLVRTYGWWGFISTKPKML